MDEEYVQKYNKFEDFYFIFLSFTGYEFENHKIDEFSGFKD